MAAPVLPVQPVKLPAGPSPITAEQKYWRSFKNQILHSTPGNTPITHISGSPSLLDQNSRLSDYFAISAGARVLIYSTRTRKLVKNIARFDDAAHSPDIRRDGRILVAGDETGSIQVFDISSRAILKTWKEHKQPVWATKFSPLDPTTLFSASDDQTVKVWDLPAQESVSTFFGHQDYVRSGSFMPGRATGLLVTGSYDQTVRLWDARSKTPAAMTFKLAAPVESVLPMHSGASVGVASGNLISVLDLVAAKPLKVLTNHQKTVTSLCLASHDSRLLSGGLDGHIKVFETDTWNVVTGMKYSSPVLALSVIKSGVGQEDKHLVAGLESGSLSIRTRLSGTQKVKERQREQDLQALIDGNSAKLRKIDAKRQTQGRRIRNRGKDFTGEGADIVLANPPTKRLRPKVWEQQLRRGKYGLALDEVVKQGDLQDTITLLTALRHRSALRAALKGRDELTLQPIFQWACVHITNPRYVSICVDIASIILELYAEHSEESTEIYCLTRKMHQTVRREVERSQQAWQTNGMLALLKP